METIKFIATFLLLMAITAAVTWLLVPQDEPTPPSVVVVDSHVSDSLRSVLADTESRIETERAKAEQWRTEADKYKARWLAVKTDNAATLPQVVDVADSVITAQDSIIAEQESVQMACEHYRAAADSLIAERDKAVERMAAESEQLRQRLADEERGTWWRRNKAWVGMAVGLVAGASFVF